MIVKSEFKVDLFQMKHTSDPAGLLQAIKDANAAALGRKLIELVPYEKDEELSYEGELPEMSLNKDHEFVDRYGVELVVITREDAEAIYQELVYHDKQDLAKLLL